MSYLSDNIKYLRSQKGFSQQKIADELIITRARYSKYEEGAAEPPLEILMRISHYFHVSIDLMISVDLRRVPMGELLKLEDNRILLPITVDRNGDNFIEIIPHKAKAGYLVNYSDPEFIQSLQHISLPFLKEGKYRAFPIEGDSMPPHQNGSFIIGSYIERLDEIKNNRTYVLLTKEGIVYKRVKRLANGLLELSSDNSFYPSYQLDSTEIFEIWEYACSIATNEFEPNDLSESNIKGMFDTLRKELAEVKNSLNRKK